MEAGELGVALLGAIADATLDHVGEPALGELRDSLPLEGDREALPLLLTLSSGVKGFTTIHAGSARQALSRLRFICQLAGTSSDLPMAALNSLVSEAVDVVVHCARQEEKLLVTEVVAVEEPQGGPESTSFTVTALFRRPSRDKPLAWTGQVPVRATQALADAGYDIRRLLGDVPARPRPRAQGRRSVPTTAAVRAT